MVKIGEEHPHEEWTGPAVRRHVRRYVRRVAGVVTQSAGRQLVMKILQAIFISIFNLLF